MPLTLSEDEAAVVTVPLREEDDLPAAFALLDTAERGRAGRFVYEADRRRFVLSHAAVRRLLGSLLDVRPDTLAFDPGAHGKPRLRAAARDVRFNLSHSGDYAIVAVAIGREVGVDVECWRPVDLPALARRFFAPAECARLERLDPPAREAAFFRIWTRKESFVKATGRGISFPLHEFDVETDGSDPVVLVAAGEQGGESRWEIRSLDAPPGCSAALTVEHGCSRILSG